MGKKKIQKTKEISVAIAETSTSKLTDDSGGGGQALQPRKRGRPRKVLDEPQNEQENKKLPQPPPDVADKPTEKKVKTTGDEPPPGSMEEASKKPEQEEPKSGDGSRSRGRRKNKPRKSS